MMTRSPSLGAPGISVFIAAKKRLRTTKRGWKSVRPGPCPTHPTMPPADLQAGGFPLDGGGMAEVLPLMIPPTLAGEDQAHIRPAGS